MHDWQHARDIGIGLRHGRARLQPRYTFVAEVSQAEFGAIEFERNNDRRILKIEEAKMFGHHADDLPAFSVHQNRFTDDCSIAAKLPLPVAVGTDGGIRRAE